jgi:hypothetical protein
MRLASTVLVCLIVLPVHAQNTADADVARVRAHPKFAQAMAALDTDHDRLVQEIITLTEIPAPPFAEDKRAHIRQRQEGNPLWLFPFFCFP